VPLPVPEPVTVHQEALEEAVQFEFDVTEKLVLPAVAATFWFWGETVKVGAGALAVNEPTIPIPA